MGFHCGTPLTVVTNFGLGLWCGICVTNFGAGIVVTFFVGVTNFDLIFQGAPGIGHKSAGHRRAKRKEADQPEVGLAPVARIQGGVPD